MLRQQHNVVFFNSVSGDMREEQIKGDEGTDVNQNPVQWAAELTRE